MDLFDFLQESTALKVEPKSWMTGGDYTLARATNETLPGIIDACIAGGRYALDLETTGLNSCVYDGETVSKIVGCCLSPDGKRGYYIPLRHRTGTEHNVSWSLWKREMARLITSPAVAVFHNGKFDQEFLQNCGGEPLGEWDDPKKWDDTLILAYLRDTRSKTKGLKHLSKTELGMEMIELDELFPEDKRKGGLDFSDLDPSWEPVTWYGASDAICTWNLYQKLAPEVLEPSMGVVGQNVVYAIEKLCVASTRWMERARILTDQNKAKELIRIGQREWIAALEEVYESSSSLVGRDIRPGYYRVLRGSVEGLESLRFDPEVVTPSYTDRIDTARTAATKAKLDPMKEKGKIATVTKRVASITTKGVSEDVEFPVVYDVLSAQQLGKLLRECKVPGLTATEKSGQVDTSKDTLEEVLEKVGDKFPFAGKIKRFREVSKALSTYLLPIIEDCHPDGTLRAYFNAHSIETGRFNAPSSKDPKVDGGTRFPFHGTPATYDPNRPACLARVRECIISRPGKILAACVAEGEMVHTDRGFLPVDEVRAGDRVVTDDGLRDVRWAGATGTKPVFKLNTSRGVSLRLTADHRVYTVGDGGFGWKPVAELAPGDWVVHAWDHVVGGAVSLPPTPALTPHEKPIKTPDTLTGDLAEFLGRFMGDGCVGHDNGLARYIGLSLGTDCDELLPHVNRQSDHLFGVAFTARDRGDVYCWSNPLCRWVNEVTGKGRTDSRGLRVPECILKGGSNTHGMFLRGLFDADGSVGKRSGDGVTLWVTSERMSLEVQVLLAGLGVHARRVRAERTTNFGHIVGYVITVAGNRPLKRFRDAVGFTARRKREALDALVAEPRNRDYSSMVPLALAKKAVRWQREAQTNACLRNGSRMGRVTYESLEACRPFPQDTDREWLERLLDGQMFFDTVESIASDGVATVYDLHVPEGSRFTVNSVVVHNCDFSGVELRIVTNLSGEGKWLREFFHCSGCDRMFPMGKAEDPIPVAPPPYCPDCGSDKIGDLHTLTALAVYGEDAPKKENWKQLRGFAKCVHPDTLVVKDGVLCTLGGVTGTTDPDTFTKSSGSVWSGASWSPVLETYNGGTKPLFHVVTNHGVLTCSNNHGLQLADGRVLTLREGLHVGASLLVPSGPPLQDVPYAPLQIRLNDGVPVCEYTPTHDTAYFAGLVSGDGSTRTASSVLVHGHVEKTDVMGTPYKVWQDILVDACVKVGFAPTRRTEAVYLGSAILARFLEHLGVVYSSPGVGKGKANRTLRIPAWVLKAGPTAVHHFVGGLMDTDGTVSKDGSPSITTKDPVFAGQIAAVLRACGKHAMMDLSWNKTYQRWYYRVRIPASQAYFLKDFMRHPGKVARLSRVTKGTLKEVNTILQIIPAGEGPCVDFHLDTEDHLYWANGLVTHNSCNFALCYGGGGNAVVTSIGCDKNEGWRIKEQFDKTYGTLSGWWKTQALYAKKHKFVTTAFKRRCPLPDIDHELGGFRAKAERNAVNAPIQGTSADITKIAMGLVYKDCKQRGWLEKVHMLITMHDELVFEIDKDILEEAIDLFVGIMCRNPLLQRLGWAVPLTSDVEMGPDWTVPWDLKKIRKKGECPPELDGCFKGIGPKVDKPKAQPTEKAVETPTVTHKVKSFSLGEVEALAQKIAAGASAPTARVKVLGPNDEDLTAVVSTVWGGKLPMVGGTL